MASSANLDPTEAPQNRGSVQLSIPYVSRICPEDITADFLARSLVSCGNNGRVRLLTKDPRL